MTRVRRLLLLFGAGVPVAQFTGGPLSIDLNGAIELHTLTNASAGIYTSSLWEISLTGANDWSTLGTTQHLTDFDFFVFPVGVYDIRLSLTGPHGPATTTATGYLTVIDGGGGG